MRSKLIFKKNTCRLAILVACMTLNDRTLSSRDFSYAMKNIPGILIVCQGVRYISVEFKSQEFMDAFFRDFKNADPDDEDAVSILHESCNFGWKTYLSKSQQRIIAHPVLRMEGKTFSMVIEKMRYNASKAGSEQ
jgi:hypothetical protein